MPQDLFLLLPFLALALKELLSQCVQMFAERKKERLSPLSTLLQLNCLLSSYQCLLLVVFKVRKCNYLPLGLALPLLVDPPAGRVAPPPFSVDPPSLLPELPAPPAPPSSTA